VFSDFPYEKEIHIGKKYGEIRTHTQLNKKNGLGRQGVEGFLIQIPCTSFAISDRFESFEYGAPKKSYMRTPGRVCLLLLFITINACKPEIYSFTASPKIITDRDSVHLHWSIRGNPELTFHQKKIPYSDGDSLQLLQFTLVAEKGGSRSAPRLLELSVLPLLYRDLFVLPVTGRHGDTLVATGTRDSLYLDFQVESMTSVTGRKILVEHNTYQTMLYDSVTRSKTFRGVDYYGKWKFQSLLTPAEKENPKLIPNQFVIAVYIRPKKP
jgi:hypothetical protein